MRAKLYERRRRLLDLRAAGVPMSMAVQQLSQDYKVFPDTIWKDWTRRTVWEDEIYRIEDKDKHIDGLLFELDQLRQKSFSLITTASHDSAKVGAIKAAMEIITRKIELLQSLGRAPRVADKMEVTDTTPVVNVYKWNPEEDATTE